MLNEQAAKELSDLEQRLEIKVPHAKITSQHNNLLWVNVHITKQLYVDATVLFTEHYPQDPLIVQLKSKTLSSKLLEGLTKLLDDNAKQLIGQYQVLPQMLFLSNYLQENIFCTCFDEFQRVKKEMCGNFVDMKAKQKTGAAVFTITVNNYQTKLKLSVPLNYPEEPVVIDFASFKSSLPEYLTSIVMKQAVEEARKCVEPPLNRKLQAKPFVIQQSFYKVAKFLVVDSFLFFKQAICKLCNEPAFPADANDVRTHPRDPHYVERVYCTHVYHYGCLHTYITTPPFAKKCVICGLVIYHERWKETPQTLEERWAHKQAKDRELDEVVDFLQ